MLSRINITYISIAYLLLLFAIAYYGDKFSATYLQRIKPLIISLSLPIYFTAWTFYGTSTQALEKGWYIPPTTVGAVIVITFGIPLVKRLIKLGKKNRSTSIAGFLSSQYGNTKSVALLITFVAFIGMLPYLSLQLKAIAMSFDLLTTGLHTANVIQTNVSFWSDTTFSVALLMAVFSIVFGTRHVDLTEHQNGLMLAIAFESLVKLVSVCFIGYYVGYQLFESPTALFQQALENQAIKYTLENQKQGGYGTAVVLGMSAIICLPRLFHVLVVESNDDKDAHTSQWVFPLYAAVLTFFILIIVVAGQLHLQGRVINSEMYFLGIPLLEERYGLALVAYIGGLSAATSMIIVATITLSTMICNDIIVPVLLRNQNFYSQTAGVGKTLLYIRRVVIIGVLLTAYAFYRLIGAYGNLGSIGLLSLSLIAQLAPSVLGALYWPRRHRNGVIAGVVTGTLSWAYLLLTPSIVQAGWLQEDILTYGPFGISWLRPESLFGMDYLDPLTNGVLWSLGLNSIVFFIVSQFFNKSHQTIEQDYSDTEYLTNSALLQLTGRFLGKEQAKLALQQHFNRRGKVYSPYSIAGQDTIKFAKSLLAGIIGPSSAKQVVRLALTRLDATANKDNAESLLQETSQALKFNRELLQASIDNMSQGITVVDSNQRLVVWNKRCIELFGFPDKLFYVGSPIEDLIRHNARQATSDDNVIEEQVNELLGYFQNGKPYSYQRSLPNTKVIEVRGEPIPNGGYVTTYTDITDYRIMVNALKDSNEKLEQRVHERTLDLTQINNQLNQAKYQAEAANKIKTRFLAAASHDLAQPLNAARLFITALQHADLDNDPGELIDYLSDSLQNAENLIKELFDIAKIDAGIVKKSISHFPISRVLDSLDKDFSVLAQNCDITFRTHKCSLWAKTDRKLLRRILQNLLSNAFRYTTKGRVVIGCRRLKGAIKIEVWDTGIGIPQKDIMDIFTEFKRLNHRGQEQGMGLGLATVHRLCLLLGLTIEVNSIVGSGSVFSVTIPRSLEPPELASYSPAQLQRKPEANLSKLTVLCIDNDADILKGMEVMLTNWGYSVICAEGLSDATINTSQENIPDVILADYHLDDDETGIDAVQQLHKVWGKSTPCIIISADQTDIVKSQSKEQGFLFQKKPVKPHTLRAALARFSAQERHG